MDFHRPTYSTYVRGEVDPFAQDELLARLDAAGVRRYGSLDIPRVFDRDDLELDMPAPFNLFEGMETGGHSKIEHGYAYRMAASAERLRRHETSTQELLDRLRATGSLAAVVGRLGEAEWALVYRGAQAVPAIAARLRERPRPPYYERQVLVRVLARMTCPERVGPIIEELERCAREPFQVKFRDRSLAPAIHTALFEGRRDAIPSLASLAKNLPIGSPLRREIDRALAAFGEDANESLGSLGWADPLAVPDEMVPNAETRAALALALSLESAPFHGAYGSPRLRLERRGRFGEIDMFSFGLYDNDAKRIEAEKHVEFLLGPMENGFRAYVARRRSGGTVNPLGMGVLLQRDGEWKLAASGDCLTY